MTMVLAAPLQTALFERLSTAPELTSLNGRIYDDAPHQSADAADAYVTIGDESVSAWDTATETGAIHNVVIRVYSPVRGFLTSKQIAGAICEALCAQDLALTRGHVITQEFIGAETRREEQGALRRIDLTFRFVIEDV